MSNLSNKKPGFIDGPRLLFIYFIGLCLYNIAGKFADTQSKDLVFFFILK